MLDFKRTSIHHHIQAKGEEAEQSRTEDGLECTSRH